MSTKNRLPVTKYLYILLNFLLITVSTLIIVSIYYCFIKHCFKQKYLLLYHDTSNKIKEIDIDK